MSGMRFTLERVPADVNGTGRAEPAAERSGGPRPSHKQHSSPVALQQVVCGGPQQVLPQLAWLKLQQQFVPAQP